MAEEEGQNHPGEPGAEPEGRLSELERLQQEVDRRIRDNRRFLENFMDEDFVDAEEEPEEDGDEPFEEL